jgi:hypothetical protein
VITIALQNRSVLVQGVLEVLGVNGNCWIHERESRTELSPKICRDNAGVVRWIRTLFQKSFVRDPGPNDVVCGLSGHTNTPAAFASLVKVNIQQYRDGGGDLLRDEIILEELLDTGQRFLLSMEQGI